ncbi:oligosaccharide flippase family protein [Halopenitus persicus]|uniref:oligosaccharide flippase family protein n=1 Tax=Halopenitus persicus TaxID=1048396 RepID=UPI000BBAE9F2|nr:oligosaccharide flippase family protein [Halopenitus persicus]
MRIGQTSFVYFLSKIVVSATGFLATLYFARVLGAGTLGVYFLILALVSWLKLAGEMGVGGALSKRISEGDGSGGYLVTGALVIGALTVILLAGIWVLQGRIEAYVGHPDAPLILALLVLVELLNGYTSAILKGQRLVQYIAGISTVRTVVRVILQVGAVYLGYELLGLVGGLAVGILIASLLGLTIVYRSLEERPSLNDWSYRHVERLLSYAKYSWLGGVRGRSFNWVDVVVLGLFVPSNLIGIYTIAWNIASFLNVFGTSIRTSMFPEISKLAAEDDTDQIRSLVSDMLAFGGLILIPGLVGGVLIGDRLLRIYGSEFVQGTAVLGLLILSVHIYDYQMQFTNALNAIDRPDLSFRVNAVFIGGNAALNLVLVSQYGWVGAAVATVVSATVGLVGAAHYLRQQIDVAVPIGTILRQWAAAGCMGVVVSGILRADSVYGIFSRNDVSVIVVAGTGAAVYFVVLYAISSRFRTVIRNNSPVEIPI